MSNNKFIREGRFGPPKAFKTGAVVGTYPKPMLVFNLDNGGLDIVTQPVEFIKPTQLPDYIAKDKSQLPPILAINLCEEGVVTMTEDFAVSGSSQPFTTFCRCINLVGQKCPWETVVVDPLTNLVGSALKQLSLTNGKAMDDPRKWASLVGNKVFQAVVTLGSIPVHSVCIMHSVIDKHELTGLIEVLPMIPSQARAKIGGQFSQYFYACIEAGKPVIYTAPKGFVNGIGCRYPANLPNPCGPTYNEIYLRK